MTVRTEDKREVHIENHRLDQKICQDLKKYDKTTGAKKREDMLKCLQRIQTRDQSAGIIYCNLNSMKEINDRQGFMGGDEVLRRAVQILSDLFGRQNIYRIGGDEFLALISEKSEEKFLDMVRSLPVQAGVRHCGKVRALASVLSYARQGYGAKSGPWCFR